MPKKAKEMAPVDVPRKPPGMHATGTVAGLYLRVSDTGARSWILRAMVGDRRREMGLGGYPDVTLALARDRAREARAMIDEGIDPIEARKNNQAELKQTPNFKWCADQTIEFKKHGWKNPKHLQQWKRTLEQYAYPYIGNMPIDEVELTDIVKLLKPIWTEKTETASRLRSRIEAVIAWATATGYRSGDNPARWRNNLDAVLAKPNRVKRVRHHPAMPMDKVNAFIKQLRKKRGVTALALEFLILTASRSGEVRGATWDEIDMQKRMWVIPAERMKASKEHRVPLNQRAIDILNQVPRMAGSNFIFAAPRGGTLSDMAFSMFMRKMNAEGVPHGFRSTFRDWAAERTSYPYAVAELALAHTIGNKVEAAYRRGDLYAKRSCMMDDWQKFIETTPSQDNVTHISKSAVNHSSKLSKA